MDEHDFRARVRRIDRLVEDVQSVRDLSARAAALELVRTVIEIHGAGMERVLQICAPCASELAKDDVIASLLLLHGLHPASMEERVAQALEKLEPVLRRRAASVRLLSIEAGVVRIRVEGAEARELVQEAVYSLAPEASEVIVDCVSEPPSGFVPLSSLVPR